MSVAVGKSGEYTGWMIVIQTTDNYCPTKKDTREVYGSFRSRKFADFIGRILSFSTRRYTRNYWTTESLLSVSNKKFK